MRRILIVHKFTRHRVNELKLKTRKIMKDWIKNTIKKIILEKLGRL